VKSKFFDVENDESSDASLATYRWNKRIALRSKVEVANRLQSADGYPLPYPFTVRFPHH
jgi:hypothetical protein